MSYQELLEHHRTAKAGMFNAKTKYERAVWMNMFRWATEEIKALTVSNTISA